MQNLVLEPMLKLEYLGTILEDEKAYGTVHFAFGDNSTFGGKTKAGIHLDVLVRKPTVYLDGEKIMDGGKLLIP